MVGQNPSDRDYTDGASLYRGETNKFPIRNEDFMNIRRAAVNCACICEQSYFRPRADMFV